MIESLNEYNLHYWNDKWNSAHRNHGRVSTSTQWDERAQAYDKNESRSLYLEEFLKLTKVSPGERILDMGCGTGNIAIPLAKAGCEVIAADFSKGMLTILEENASDGIADSITPMLISWEDDWRNSKLFENCVDTAISSRSISKTNLLDSIAKLNWAASSRCIVTVCADFSTKVDQRIFEICNLGQPRESDHIYLLNVLQALGASPRCTLIANQRSCEYESFEDALCDYQAMLERCLASMQDKASQIPSATKAVSTWLEEMLVESSNERESSKATLTLKQPRVTTWAYITWDPSSIQQDLAW